MYMFIHVQVEETNPPKVYMVRQSHKPSPAYEVPGWCGIRQTYIVVQPGQGVAALPPPRLRRRIKFQRGIEYDCPRQSRERPHDTSVSG